MRLTKNDIGKKVIKSNKDIGTIVSFSDNCVRCVGVSYGKVYDTINTIDGDTCRVERDCYIDFYCVDGKRFETDALPSIELYTPAPFGWDFTYSAGLAVMRCQPLHIGHVRLIKEMLKQCSQALIVLGSIQEHGTERNPWTFSERKKMIKNCFPDDWQRIRVYGVEDINNSMAWANHVLTAIDRQEKCHFLASLDSLCYFGGSYYDCHWFAEAEISKPINYRVLDRADSEFPFVSGSLIRDMLKYGDSRWKQFVPECNWNIESKCKNGMTFSKDAGAKSLEATEITRLAYFISNNKRF